jgi:hypothetical protein
MPDRKTVLLLKIMADAAGRIDASDHRHSMLNYFCGDRGAGHDTFNLARMSGLIRVENYDDETSTAFLTDAGRAALPSHAQKTGGDA